jgi:hypothetical protein
MKLSNFIYSVIIPVLLILNTDILSGDKIYLSSENDYVTVLSASDWEADVNSYAGTYEFIYPGYTEKMEYEGDAFGEDLIIEKTESGSFFAYKKMTVEASWEEIDTLKNISLSGDSLISENYSGRFSELKYKTKKGKVKKTNGVFLLRTGEIYDSFYQKIK